MAKKDFSNLQGLRYPSIFKAKTNEDENFFVQCWEIIGVEVGRLSELAWKDDLNGYEDKSNGAYRAINIYYYMVHLLLSYNKELVRKGLTEPDDDMIAKYKFDCVEAKFQCLNKELGNGYHSVFGKFWELMRDIVYAFPDGGRGSVVYADWYVPSVNDLVNVYHRLVVPGTLTFTENVWSSSDTQTQFDKQGAWNLNFTDGIAALPDKTELHNVIAARQFYAFKDQYQLGDKGQAGYIYDIVDYGTTSLCFEISPVVLAQYQWGLMDEFPSNPSNVDPRTGRVNTQGMLREMETTGEGYDLTKIAPVVDSYKAFGI